MFEGQLSGDKGSVFKGYSEAADKILTYSLGAISLTKTMMLNTKPKFLPFNMSAEYTCSDAASNFDSTFRHAEWDVAIYHLYGLFIHSRLDEQRDMNRRGNPNAALTFQSLNWMRDRMVLDTIDTGVLDYGEFDTDVAKSVTLTDAIRHHRHERCDVSVDQDRPAAFVLENPGSLAPLVLPDDIGGPSGTSLMAIVHGHPTIIRNAPTFSKATSSWIFDRDRIEVVLPLHGLIQGKNNKNTVVKNQPYTIVPSGHKSKITPTVPEGYGGAHAFANDYLAPIIREDFGRLLPRKVHERALAECYEGNFILKSPDPSFVPAVSKVQARADFYSEDNLSGIF